MTEKCFSAYYINYGYKIRVNLTKLVIHHTNFLKAIDKIHKYCIIKEVHIEIRMTNIENLTYEKIPTYVSRRE